MIISKEQKKPALTGDFKQFIYHFGPKGSKGSAKMKDLLGGKGANLAEMSRMGLPVPPGFTLTTALCDLFYQNGETLPKELFPEIEKSLSQLENLMEKRFGDPKNPLLLSVRSGAPLSMPGMMDTVLNLGLNETTLEGLIKHSGNPGFAWDTYRRFIQMYSDVVMGMNASLLEVYLEDYKNQKGYQSDTDMKVEDWQKTVRQFKETILQDTGKLFPEDPKEQLWSAISAVFKSWNNPRAIVYRQMGGNNHKAQGTAVNVQAMVFGNRGEDCATGVVFTRNPSTGEKSLFGEFLVNAQGEDVVAGVRTPQPILNGSGTGGAKDLRALMPETFDELSELCRYLETHYKYIQDIEFTVEKKKLWLLQTRNGKCSAKAQLKIACDLMDEGLLDEKQTLARLNPTLLEKLLHPSIDTKGEKTVLARGLPASPGGAVGQIVFSSAEALELSRQGRKVILVRRETTPEDINGMISSQGIFTTRGGMTSHAAVVARSMGKPCIVGCEEAQINEDTKELKFKTAVLRAGDVFTLDGTTGEVLKGAVSTKPAELNKDFFRLMALADKYSRMEVRANADTPADVKKSREFGAKGVGLCRTEHMFFAPDRLNIMRQMILSEDKEERQPFLDSLFSMQKKDFQELLDVMNGYPVTIRLLDPPLHEFLPHTDEDIENLVKECGWSSDRLTAKVNQLRETNPMLGHRGCRLAITCPEIYLMQTRAVAAAAAQLKKEKKNPCPEIMIPLVALPSELKILKSLIQVELKKAEEEFQVSLPIPVGAMIELPSACLQAGKIADEARFLSFGTNDLTQTTLGLSRDDSGKFLASYINQELMERDPFHQVDQNSVGELMKIALKSCHEKPVKMGICGEHGGNPESIRFFHKIGLHYVSCSPYRIPVARLSAAQATLEEK
ncbi:MAG: pyruvate, phosphate dikinase [Bdellovibrionales bacterium]|nr:pyruvate, phosphate dikinase [Bdellovibrionales bacterium]